MDFPELLTVSSSGNLLVKLALNCVALLAATAFVKDVQIKDITRAIIATLIIALLNATVGEIMDFFAWPLTMITLGLFSFVVDAAVILLAAHFMDGFKVKKLPRSNLPGHTHGNFQFSFA